MIPGMDLAREILYLALGFFLLAKGSNWLVTGSSVIADRMGVRQLVIGLTVVAWGTSAPEVVVSGLAAVEGKVGLSMGNVLGSNIANLALVLGASAVILPKVLQGSLAKRETFWLLASVAIFWWRASDLMVDRVDGMFLLGAVIIYNLQLLWEARERTVAVEPAHEGYDSWAERLPRFSAVAGALTIAGAAWLTIQGATGIAHRYGMSESLIGLTILAVGTSLPELAAGVSGALKGKSDISLGNVVGSNVFNVTGVIGVVAMIRPFGGPDEPNVQEALRENLAVDFPMVMLFSVAALVLTAVGGKRGGRAKGFLLLAAYFSYVTYQVLTDSPG
jgi:cation:H+ antiporter